MAAGNYQGTYDASQVASIVGGAILSGFTDGDFVTAEYADDRYTMLAGADGEVGRSRNPSRAGSITFVLASTSIANDQLSALSNIDALGGVDAPIPIAVTDLSGRTVIACSKGWLRVPPSVSFGTEVGEREWIYDCADLTMFVGGNN